MRNQFFPSKIEMKNMKVLILLSCLLCCARGLDLSRSVELKVDYYEKLIRDAFKEAKSYKLREDNSDMFPNMLKNGPIDYGTFDFIVVGAGSSGSIVATRLTEVESFKVLLLEAGEWDNDLSTIPYFAGLLQLSDYNWGYYTTPQKNGCWGWENRQCSYPRGKVVGGSGSINALSYVRGNENDYNTWAAMGNSGWSFEDVLPYFKKMENFQSEYIDLNLRGFGGELNVAYVQPMESFSVTGDASAELNVSTIQDYNGRGQIGVSRIQKNIKGGQRVSGSTAYVRPSMGRINFNLTVRAYVTKVLIDEVKRSAYGVQFVKDGKLYRAKANREVILSGGAVNSPQLLMLSGIGPRKELNKHKIPVIADLPVGTKTYEHYIFKMFYKSNMTKHGKPFREDIKDFLGGKGILTNFGNGVSLTFLNTKDPSSTIPNTEIVFYYPSPVTTEVPSQVRFTKEAQAFMDKTDPHTDFYTEIFLYHPKSTGSLKLKSASPKDFPLIDPGVFADLEDLETMYESVKFVNKLGNTTPFKINGAEQIKYDFCNQYEYNSKQYWYCAMQHLAIPCWHLTTSAKMGPESDPMAVVDSRLRVYGVKKLRVVDCSIFPTPITGHNNGPAFMVGEKAADMIKEDHLYKKEY